MYKLENGKYVAPAPLETAVTLSPYISQCVVYGSNKPHNVALIVPDLPAVTASATQHGNTTQGDDLLSEPRVQELLEDELGKANEPFKDFERIRGFVIEAEEFTAANELLTPTLKLKRRNFNDRYAPALEALYAADAEPAPGASFIRELKPKAKGKTGS